jgi:hypothetical protein
MDRTDRGGRTASLQDCSAGCVIERADLEALDALNTEGVRDDGDHLHRTRQTLIGLSARHQPLPPTAG